MNDAALRLGLIVEKLRVLGKQAIAGAARFTPSVIAAFAPRTGTGRSAYSAQLMSLRLALPWPTVLFVGLLLFGLAAAAGLLWRQKHAALYRQKYEAEHKVHAITESAQDAILMMDPKGRVSYWNPAAERILGYTSAEALG
jgi:PAS domain-containing protein